MKNFILLSIAYLFIFVSCKKHSDSAEFSEKFLQWNNLTIETMKTDGINPVLATRIYLYPNIAAYEVLANATDSLLSLSGRVNDLQSLPKPENPISIEWAAITAYYKTMITLNYREDLLHQLYEKQSEITKQNFSSEIFQNSIDYGNQIATLIIDWADRDQYKQTKGLPYYLSSIKPGTWIPTPPEYRPALEPHWGSLRTLTIDSLKDFSEPFLINFSTDSTTQFYALAKEVYDSSLVLSDDQKHQALFWDDNPDLNNFKGHIPTPRRHINPTAHWMSIISQLIQKEGFSFAQTVEIYTMAVVAFYDANLVCWFDKYNTNLIRPVTYIQQHIDADWMPLLVTPPFPEHTSGHSACSAASATVLEHFFGKNYTFTDSTHFEVGLGIRSFSSIMDAAWEVSYSRFYGGIHYKTGVIQGTQQGIKVGNHIIEKLEL